MQSFVLSAKANRKAADLNVRYISSNSTFSCNVMTFLSFLGAFLASIATLCVVPMVLFKAYSIAIKMMKMTQGLQGVTFYCDAQFTGETNCLLGDDLPSVAF